MIYEVDGENFTEIEDVLNHCIEDSYHEDDDDFEDYVNDRYGYINIYGDDYRAYDILEALDEYSLGQLRNEYCNDCNNNDREEAKYELDHAEDGEYIYIQNYTVICHDYEGDFDGDDQIKALKDQMVILEYAENIRKKEQESAENDVMKLIQVIK